MQGVDRHRHVTVRGDHDDDRMVVADRIEDVESGHVGEPDVEEHEVGPQPAIRVDALLTRVRLRDLVGAVVPEERGERRGDRDLVVDDQDAGHALRRGPAWVGRRPGV